MYVRIEKEGSITTVIMDRPDKRNAVDRFMAEELREAFLEFEADDEQRVAVLWGDHGVFCAGADLGSMNDPDRIVQIEADGSGHGPMGPSRIQMTKPLIAATPGYAVAGGLELALLADMRVAEESSIFGVYCRRWGVPLIDGGTIRLPRVVGMGRAMDMILTGRPVNAEEALQFPTGNLALKLNELPMRFPNSRKHVCAQTAYPPMNNGICRSKKRCAVRGAPDNPLWSRKAKAAPQDLWMAQAGTGNFKAEME